MQYRLPSLGMNCSVSPSKFFHSFSIDFADAFRSQTLMILGDKDPIVAVATAAGHGGIGILRLSFPGAMDGEFICALFGDEKTLTPRHAHLMPVRGMDGAVLDRGIILYFPAPHSYTGETVIEIQAHGGPVLMNMLMKAVLAKCEHLGLRLAEPGEFTKRAFLNGRMDLAQAEAVADLIDAASESAVEAATRSLSGEFSKKIRSLADETNELRAFVEATLDFPEEEIDNLSAGRILERACGVRAALEDVLQNACHGSVLREGVTVAIVGSPNVGKSSLLNALAQEEIAIVTDIPGTTRDRIEHWVTIGGVPVRMVDTAGIRKTTDVVESKGIERTLSEIRKADVVLHLTDASGGVPDDDAVLARVLAEVRPGVPLVHVCNKTDLVSGKDDGMTICISAKTGEGLAVLKKRLLTEVGMAGSTDGLFMARERHLHCLRTALHHMDAALLIGTDISMIELLAEELRLAGQALGEILGETTADDILGLIFSKFCIGK